MSLQDDLDALKVNFRAGKEPFFVPPEIHVAMERATAELIASGQATRTLKAGDQAPNFILADHDGKTVSSADLLAKGRLIITFYRGIWCPYCNFELQALNKALPTFLALGAHIVAISPQTASNSRKLVDTNKLGFPVLSDPANAVAAAFGLHFTLPGYMVDIYKQLKNDLPAFNGDESWTLPMPARYVVDNDGTILYSEVNPDYTQRPDPVDMLPILLHPNF